MTEQIREQVERYQKLDVSALSSRFVAEVGTSTSGVPSDQLAVILARCASAIERELHLAVIKEVPIRGQEQIASQFGTILDRIDAGENAQSWHGSVLDFEYTLWSLDILGGSEEAKQLMMRAGDLRRTLENLVGQQKQILEIINVGGEIDAIKEEIESLTATAAGSVAEAKKAVETLASDVGSGAAAMAEIDAKKAESANSATEAKTHVNDIASTLTAAKQKLESIGALVAKATETNTRLDAYENELQALRDQYQEQHDRIEGLLPGAASAGLASAFELQQRRFAIPKRFWMGTFIFSMVLLLAVACLGIQDVLAAPGTITLQEIGAHLLKRLPFAIPIIWLAIYAGRHHMLAARLEEEYAYKAAVSRAFEGYKREMTAIPTTDGSAPPLNTLCVNVLEALARSPGRIYEGKHEDITPARAVADLCKEVAGLVKEAKKPPG